MLLPIIYASNKAFDIIDEGYYLIHYQNYQPKGLQMTWFGTIIAQTFAWIPEINIITAGVIRFIVSTLSAFFSIYTLFLYPQIQL